MQMLDYPHDDLYFAKAAEHLIRGQWLGPYDNMTLIKAPFYPFFLVGSFLTGLPLLLNETIFYLLSCLVLFLALAPLIKSRWWRLLLFAVMLYIPAFMATSVTLRILREFVYYSVTLFVVAFSIGLFLRLDKKISTLLLWAIGLGLSMGAFMLTREEGVWIYPILFVLFTVSIVIVWKRNYPRKWLRSGLIVLPILLWYLPIIAVSAVNYSYYGFWGTTEQLAPDFNRVVDLLASIKTDNTPWNPLIQISKEARMKAYAASPLFKTMQGDLEASVITWNISDDAATAVKPAWLLKQYGNGGDEISDSFFLWTLRDVIAHEGYYSEGKYPADFYKQLGDELDLACAEGRLSCDQTKSLPFVGPVDPRHIPIITRMFTQNVRMILYQAVYYLPSLDLSTWPVWPVADEEYRYFEQITNDPINYMGTILGRDSQNQVEGAKDFRWKILLYKEYGLKKITSVFKQITAPAASMAVGLWICLIVTMIFTAKKRWQLQYMVISLILVMLFVIRVLTVSIVGATTSANVYIYTISTYIFLYLFIVTVGLWMVESARQAIGKQEVTEVF